MELLASRTHPPVIWMQTTAVPLRSLTFRPGDPWSHFVLKERSML